jgi:hypothetical protein
MGNCFKEGIVFLSYTEQPVVLIYFSNCDFISTKFLFWSLRGSFILINYITNVESKKVLGVLLTFKYHMMLNEL